MSKVYIVTRGTYSDYHIEAVFTSKEIVDRYVKLLNSGYVREEYYVEEWETDKWDDSRTVFSVGISGGGVAKYCFFKDTDTSDDDFVGTVNAALPPIRPQLFTIEVKADSREHAIKIAMERWRERKANGDFDD